MKPHAELPYTALPDLTDAERIVRARDFREDVAARRTCRMFAPTPVPRPVIVAGLPADCATIAEYATRKKPLEQIASWH